ncbi:MAG: m-phase inducer phosphatase [Paramarteilia canceri]
MADWNCSESSLFIKSELENESKKKQNFHNTRNNFGPSESFRTPTKCLPYVPNIFLDESPETSFCLNSRNSILNNSVDENSGMEVSFDMILSKTHQMRSYSTLSEFSSPAKSLISSNFYSEDSRNYSSFSEISNTALPLGNILAEPLSKKIKNMDNKENQKLRMPPIVDYDFKNFQSTLPSESLFGVNVIDWTTLCSLVDGKLDKNLKWLIFDCRYPYEYEGGHIQYAENAYKISDVNKILFRKLDNGVVQPIVDSKTILIFHCEFSVNRAPALARKLRKIDRKLNENSYPKLHFPEIYLLKGGYKNFFYKASEKCTPCTYRKMHDVGFLDDMKYYRHLSKENSNILGELENKMKPLSIGRSRSLKF